MVDDKKKNPLEQTSEDQEKGGEATAIEDIDVTDVSDESTEESDTTDETSLEEDTQPSTGVESDDEENM